MTVAERYTDELVNQYNYLATWFPSVRLKPGDIGTFNKQRLFVAEAALDGFGIEAAVGVSPARTEFSHSSAREFNYQVKLAGEANALTPNLPLGTAGIGMQFNGEGAVFFQLGGVVHERVADQIELARRLLRLANDGEWDKSWVVVTEVIRASSAVILVSESKGGSAELTVDADVSAMGLQALTAGAKVSLMHSSSLSTKIAGASGLTPLFRAVRIKRRWFIGQRTVAPAYSSEVEEIVISDEVDPSSVLEDVISYTSSEDK